MGRIHLFELMDQSWYPDAFWRIQTDYLQHVTTQGSGQENLVPLLAKAMQQVGTDQVVDLCSGATDPWLILRQQLARAGQPVRVRLVDKHPHREALQRWADLSGGTIEYLSEPVDATQAPSHLEGMRTLFEGFHHFKPDQAEAIRRDAAEKRVPNRTALGVGPASAVIACCGASETYPFERISCTGSDSWWACCCF